MHSAPSKGTTSHGRSDTHHAGGCVPRGRGGGRCAVASSAMHTLCSVAGRPRPVRHTGGGDIRRAPSSHGAGIPSQRRDHPQQTPVFELGVRVCLVQLSNLPSLPSLGVTHSFLRGVLRVVVGAIARVHSAGVVHNDLHPGNVMLHRLRPNSVQVCAPPPAISSPSKYPGHARPPA